MNEFLHLVVQNLFDQLNLMVMIHYYHPLMLLHQIFPVNDEYFHLTKKKDFWKNKLFVKDLFVFVILLVSNKDQSYSIYNQHSLYLFLIDQFLISIQFQLYDIFEHIQIIFYFE